MMDIAVIFALAGLIAICVIAVVLAIKYPRFLGNKKSSSDGGLGGPSGENGFGDGGCGDG
ncbi:MAG: hypothetical protein WBD01_15705 [Salaquimonas sp.]